MFYETKAYMEPKIIIPVLKGSFRDAFRPYKCSVKWSTSEVNECYPKIENLHLPLYALKNSIVYISTSNASK